MKNTIFEDKKIVVILWIALGVLIVCVAATFFHVYDIKNVYQKKTIEGFESNIELANSSIEYILSSMKTSMSFYVNDYERVFDTARYEGANEVAIEDVQRILKTRSSNIYNTRFYYVQEESVLVSSDTVMYKQGLYDKFEKIDSYRFNNSFVYSRGDLFSSEIFGEDSIIGIRRINSQNGNHLYFIVCVDLRETYKEEIFSLINDMGFYAVYDTDGNVISITDDYMESIPSGSNMFSGLFDLTDLSIASNKKINNLLRSVSSYSSGSAELKSSDAKTSLVYAGTFDSAKNLSYMVYLNPGMLEKGVRGGAIRSYFICLFMILIMIALILYIWFTLSSSNNKIIRLAYIDDVTDGYNYNYFKTITPRLLAASKETPYFVIRFDVLNFRYINESYGHDKADKVLEIIVDKYYEVFEVTKEICVRINSDQFVAVAKNNLEFEDKYEAYIKAVSDAAKEVGVKYPIRLRMGLYQIRKDDDDIEVMIDRANVARKSVDISQNLLLEVYSDKIITSMRKVDAIESDMEKSLAKGEFKVFIQPKWDIVSDRIVGGEALVRWIKDDGSMIYPNDFIPVFESNGFIENLDFYMLEQLCIRMKEMKKEDEKYEFFPISVNQSRILISNPDYVRNIEKTLKRFEADVQFIQLEITENVFFNEREKMLAVVNSLKGLGLELAMDDFGSGYSSLNILKDIPFDVLKIDKAFFDESILSDASKVILKKILEMASALGIEVICEGVETIEQVEMLKEFGCTKVQGYYYGKPMPMNEFIDLYCIRKES